MKKSTSTNKRAAGLLKASAFLSVLAAYIFGLLGEEKDYKEKLLQAYPYMSIITSKGKDPVCYLADFPEGEKYVLLYKTMGWGGPALVATKMDTSGYVEEVKVVDHHETPAFFASLVKNEFFRQYQGKYMADDFSIDGDVQAVSGATISSQGFNTALKKSCHSLAETEFQMNLAEDPIYISYSDPGYLILLLFILSYLGCRFGLRRFRIVVQLAAIVIIGFLLNYPLSMSYISSLFMGFFPNPESNITWYILLASLAAMLVFAGKNLYCTWVCPFGAIQDLLNKISGISMQLPPWLIKYSKWSSGVIAWFSICVIFASRNPALGTFEPFAAIFGFKGFGIIWVVLPVMIFSSFFIKRMWCRFFCPVGFLLNGACKMRNKTIQQIHTKDEKAEVKLYSQHHDHCA